MTKRSLLGAFLLTTALFPCPARAQDSSAAAAADVLFRQGRQLHDDKRYAEACPKFAESYRLDPATGSLLALASCHEAEGKLASAWAEYNEVMDRARRDGQAERVETARQRLSVLEPKLAKLALMLAPGSDVPGLVVKRNTIVIGSGALGVPLPVDKGEHTIEASAPGFQSFTRKVTIADGATQVLTIPKLSASGAPIVAPAPASAPIGASPSEPTPAVTSKAPAADTTSGAPSTFPFKPLGVVAIVGGVLAAGGGTVFGIQALSKNSDSNANGRCVGDVCDAEGTRLRLDARDAGNLSTTFCVVSGLLVAGGITLFIIGGAKSPKSAAIVPAAGPQHGSVALRGAF